MNIDVARTHGVLCKNGNDANRKQHDEYERQQDEELQ